MSVVKIKTQIPGPESRKLIENWHKYEADVVGYQAPVVWKNAQGCVVNDVDGNCFIDWITSYVLYFGF